MKGSRYKKITRECYDRVLDLHGGRCDIEDVRDAILSEILTQGISDDVVDEFVDGLLSAEDSRRARDDDSGQLDLLTGDEAALDGIWRLGDGQRIVIRHANREDCYRHLGLKAENVARVTEAFAKDQARISRLMPYMTDPSITVEEARRLHQAVAA